MTEPWKPQPGKPAMTRDEKTLVTDLARLSAEVVWSKQRQHTWTERGFSFHGGDGWDLIKPTAEILAAHGIDADGKPVRVTCPKCGATSGDDWKQCNGVCPLPDSPRYEATPSTRVDDRWFQAACAALTGVISAGAENYPSCASAVYYADALMAEVAKREGR